MVDWGDAGISFMSMPPCPLPKECCSCLIRCCESASFRVFGRLKESVHLVSPPAQRDDRTGVSELFHGAGSVMPRGGVLLIC